MIVETFRIELKRPLLIVHSAKGFLACGYINIETCNRTDDACALVNAGNFDDMKLALEPVRDLLSKNARKAR